MWEQAELQDSTPLMAARAGEAARNQGPDLFNKFHLALLMARHGGSRFDFKDRDLLTELAEQEGLDPSKFRKDLDDYSLLKRIADDHEYVTQEHNAFGSPTIIFPNGGSVYIKIHPPSDDQVIPIFDSFVNLVSSNIFVGEVKRPQPPWPRDLINPSRE